MKNSAVAVARTEKKSTLIGIKIPKIKQYHFFELNDTHTIMWRYLSIGQGVLWKHNPVTFSNKLEVVKPLSVTSGTNRYVPTSSSKKRVTREFCNLHFCLENRCNAAFHNQLQLEQRMLSEQHSVSSIKMGMDKVKLSFIN